MIVVLFLTFALFKGNFIEFFSNAFPESTKAMTIAFSQPVCKLGLSRFTWLKFSI